MAQRGRPLPAGAQFLLSPEDSAQPQLLTCGAVSSKAVTLRESSSRALKSRRVQHRRLSGSSLPFAAINLHLPLEFGTRECGLQVGRLGALFPGSQTVLLHRHGVAATGWRSYMNGDAIQHALGILVAAVAMQPLHPSSAWSISDARVTTAHAMMETASWLRLPGQSQRYNDMAREDASTQMPVERPLTSGEATVRKLLAGGLAGAVSKSCVAPLERLTTIMMADAPGQGMLMSLKNMWRDGGLLGMWSGNAATLAKIFPQTAIQFAAFHTLKEAISANSLGERRELGNMEYMMLGSLAGLMACSATYPLDTMRTQMSVTGGLKGGLFSVGRQIVKSGGVGALYKGFGATLTSDVLGSGLGFMNYEIGTKLYRELNGGRSPSPVEKGIIGALAASATLTLIMPLEVVRRRLQIQGSCGRPVIYKGTLDAFAKIYRAGGVGAFYEAAVSNYLKVAPSIGSVYFLYDFFCTELGLTPRVPARA
eukprot:jgi/Tetstr1/443763/TSEL_031751.t1